MIKNKQITDGWIISNLPTQIQEGTLLFVADILRQMRMEITDGIESTMHAWNYEMSEDDKNNNPALKAKIEMAHQKQNRLGDVEFDLRKRAEDIKRKYRPHASRQESSDPNAPCDVDMKQVQGAQKLGGKQ